MESRILQLISALRASGVRVSLAESAEAFSAVELMGIQDREQFRLSLRSTLIKDLRDMPTFDELFPLFFGAGQPPVMGGNPSDEVTPEEARMLADALRQLTNDLRQQLERLMNGEPLSRSELDALAQMVGLQHVDDLRRHKRMAQRMMKAMEFPEVRKSLQELMELLAEMGMSRQRLEQIQRMVQQNLQGIQDQIERFAGEQIAENLSEKAQHQSSDDLLSRPFNQLTDADKKNLEREVNRLAASLRTRIALRQNRAKSGKLDIKGTIRRNLKYQGIPLELQYKERVRKPRIVAICDISTSMRFCSELMLGFLYALQGQVSKTYAFAFIDHLEYISNDFNSADANQAIASVLWRMPSGHYNTDLGWSLDNFTRDYLDMLNSQTTLIVLGDGRNNYNDPRLDLFSTMIRRARRTIWLNPEPPTTWFGDSDMPQYAPLCDNVLKVSTLSELAQAIDTFMTN